MAETSSSTMSISSKRAAPPQLIFDDGSRVMAEEAVVDASASIQNPTQIRGDVSVEEYYEIDRIAKEVVTYAEKSEVNQGLFRVALQFPDELLADSPDVCWAIENRLSSTLPTSTTALVFCLGDTTVGSCCPDEVAALHLAADVMVHYGHACLSPTGTLPVIYSFGRSELDINKAVTRISKEMGTIPSNILLLYEVGYHHAMVNMQNALRGLGTESVVVGRIPQPTRKVGRPVNATSCCGGTEQSAGNCCNNEYFPGSHTLKGETALNDSSDSTAQADNSSQDDDPDFRSRMVVGGLELPESITSWDQLAGHIILFVGEYESTSKRQYVNMMLRFLSLSNPPEAFWVYSPKRDSLSSTIPTPLQRQLNRRFFLTQKARDARVFGILVSNLSQQHLVDVVKSLKARIQDAGKASYSFAVGKINPAKLANFAEIECFVLVACREHSLLDEEREYSVPVITPLELDVALGNLEWGAQAYSLDCQDVLSHLGNNGTSVQTKNESDDDAPYFSLVTGKYVQQAKTGTETALELENLPGRGQVTAYNSEAANFLKQREYQGLNTLVGQTEAKPATMGQRGIASDYGGS